MERLAPEQHDSLDGVPEPSESVRLIGHEAAVRALAGAYRAGKLPHAVMLTGSQGIGKATLAFQLAHHLLKHRRESDAPEHFDPRDPQSPLHRQIAAESHPAVLHLTRPQNDKRDGFKMVLSVDEIRRVSRFLSMTSHDGSYRIVIVDPADDMNRNAANALLKNLEEPPARTIFLLVVHQPGALLPTIRSRCQVVRVEPLGKPELFEVLGNLGFAGAATDTARDDLALRAGGSPRRAILLTEYGGMDIASATEKLAASPQVDAIEAHSLADAVAGKDRAIQFSLFNKGALDLLARAAGEAAAQGAASRANRISEAWEKSRVAILDAETYNLDRKQHALSMILRLNDTLRM
jgi:DNA polymerase-3 subunit delta'